MMQQTPNRSPVTEYLRGEATGVDDPTLKAEIEQITDWFNRGYNRMATKKQGANVFCSLHLGQTPETPETGARVEIDTSILKLGGMGSEAFAALHSRWQKSRKVDPDAKKPVTQRFWGPLFDEIEKALLEVKAPGELKALKGNENNPMFAKMQKYASISSFRVGWVGDLEYGHPGEWAARIMDTESRAGAFDGRTTASSTEVSACNPIIEE